MCGISGILSYDRKYNREDILRMNKMLSHRGPDDEGTYFDDFIGLGHRRLSIIDLSKAGHQPMSDESERYWIIFNGEVYNYLEIREELVEKGYEFHSNTDTEVILKSYIEWGVDCLKKFNGMWAFALWDKEKKELFCARDRFGVKPFYYYHEDGYFVFASEIKAILEAEGILREPNYERILQYLGNYPLLENKSTFFNDIFQLPASHYALIKKDEIKIERYWDIEKKSVEGVDAKERFLELFKDSISLRLRSDVPVGTCLSGGLDSSSIVCVLNKMIDPTKQKTFSSCFEDKRFDEREYIEEVVKATSVTPFYTFPDINHIYPQIEKIVWHQDEPFDSTSIFAQWSVMELAKKNGVIVLLDGQGSDEALAGYIPYKWFLLLDSFNNKNPVYLLKNSLGLFKSLKDYKNYTNRSYYKILKRLVASKFISKEKVKSSRSYYLKREFIDKYKDNLKLNYTHKFNSKLENKLYHDVYYSALPRLLQYEDRDSMAFSLESRVPFLDYRFVEFIFSLPVSNKIKNGWTKYILRKSMKDILPEKIRCRKDKMGFVTPQDMWLATIKDKVKDIFNSKEFLQRPYIDSNGVSELLEKYYGGDYSLSNTVWKLYCIEIWMRVFFEKKLWVNNFI